MTLPDTKAGLSLLEYVTHPSQKGARNDLTRRIRAVEAEARLSDEDRLFDIEAERDAWQMAQEESREVLADVKAERDRLREALVSLVSEETYWSYAWSDGRGLSWNFHEMQPSHHEALLKARAALETLCRHYWPPPKRGKPG